MGGLQLRKSRDHFVLFSLCFRSLNEFEWKKGDVESAFLKSEGSTGENSTTLAPKPTPLDNTGPKYFGYDYFHGK